MMPVLEALAPSARGRLACAIIVSSLAALAAIGCSQSSGPQLAPGRVTCEPLAKLSAYRFRAEVTYDLAARDPSQEPTDPYGPDAFNLTQSVEGAVQKGGRVEATVRATTAPSTPTSWIVAEGRAWVDTGNDVWTPVDVGTGTPPVAYLPLDTCMAIAPDIDVSGEIGEAEAVGEVASQKYSFDALASDLPDRHPNLGASSDVARLIDEFRGAIWIAEKDRYITKLDLQGSGDYGNGRKLNVKISYEVFDQNQKSIRIEPPD